jgi:hypothetical protein
MIPKDIQQFINITDEDVLDSRIIDRVNKLKNNE